MAFYDKGRLEFAEILLANIAIAIIALRRSMNQGLAGSASSSNAIALANLAYRLSRSIGSRTSVTRKYLARAGCFFATSSYMA
jgi:hypothetical protein